tara:strand:+ start:25784 stop:26104 length:321 start_codon:yes stop_codon:yes gene_type:complete
MKLFFTALVLMISGVSGCSSVDSAVSEEVEYEVTVEDIMVEDLESEDVSLDETDVVPTVEEDTEENLDSEETPEISEEDEPGLDEDPTSFENNPVPDSSFFLPQIP